MRQEKTSWQKENVNPKSTLAKEASAKALNSSYHGF